jgi:PncC family amidohydrolase
VFGLSESYLGTRIEELHLPSEIKISYRPNSPEILLTISASTKVSESPLSPAVEKILTAIGSDFVFSTSAHNSMAEEVVRILNESGNTIAVAESCSGGKIADLLTSIPGVSNCFLASAVTYSNQSKSSLVEVNPATIEGYGAISPETAKEMAIGIKKRTGATIGISATGIAGPDGGSDDKPVGTFYIGIATAKGADTYKFFMSTERNLFRRYVAFTALDLVRRQLTGLPLDWRRQ